MSTGQERRFIRIVFVFLLLSILWVFFAPGAGLLSLFTKKARLNKLENETARMEEENRVLQKDIDRLLNDPAYLEKVARNKFKLLKENEKVYDFSREGNRQ